MVVRYAESSQAHTGATLRHVREAWHVTTRRCGLETIEGMLRSYRPTLSHHPVGDEHQLCRQRSIHHAGTTNMPPPARDDLRTGEHTPVPRCGGTTRDRGQRGRRRPVKQANQPTGEQLGTHKIRLLYKRERDRTMQNRQTRQRTTHPPDLLPH